MHPKHIPINDYHYFINGWIYWIFWIWIHVYMSLWFYIFICVKVLYSVDCIEACSNETTNYIWYEIKCKKIIEKYCNGAESNPTICHEGKFFFSFFLLSILLFCSLLFIQFFLPLVLDKWIGMILNWKLSKKKRKQQINCIGSFFILFRFVRVWLFFNNIH